MNPGYTVFAALALSASLAGTASAQQPDASPRLIYDAQPRGPVPIPPSERGLQTVTATLWFKVSDKGLVLEGPASDRSGNLLFCDVYGGRVLRVTPDQRLSTVFAAAGLAPGGIAIHKDGRIFIASVAISKAQGPL